MRLHRCTSFALPVLMLCSVLAQTPKNIVMRATPKSVKGGTARAENILLQDNLVWSFGGKAQHGWQLYLALISCYINCDVAPDQEEFAEALARWQQLAGLTGSGILDQETWMRMVEHWQQRRSKDRTIPTAEKLLTVSASEFYDPERPSELRQVERATYAAYQRMRAAAMQELGLKAQTDNYLKIISAFRSPEYQQKLRAQSPHSGRAGLAINSPHFTGRALDLYVGGEPVSTKDANRALQVNTPVYRWLVKNAGKFGFIPYFYEPWHWEYNPQAAQS